MTTKKMILEMMRLQDILNINTNGDEWHKGFTKEGRSINWFRCIHMEAAELIDSFPWKHWKNIHLSAEPDIKNVRVEIVDIWHFVLSKLIFNSKKCGQPLEKYIGHVLPIIEVMGECENEQSETSNENIIKLTEVVMIAALSKDIFHVVYCVLDVMKAIKMSFSDVYALYIGKNALNKFRQDNGYKEGTYKKQWELDGDLVEDNVVMTKIIKENPLMTYEQALLSLQEVYK